MENQNFIKAWNKASLATKINIIKTLGYDWPYPYIQDFVVNKIFQDIEYNFRMGMLERAMKKAKNDLDFDKL